MDANKQSVEQRTKTPKENFIQRGKLWKITITITTGPFFNLYFKFGYYICIVFFKIANKSATSSATSCYEESDELAKQGREIRRVKPVIDEAIHHDNRALRLLLEREELTHVTNEDIKRTQQPMFLTASSAKSIKRRSSEIDDSLPKLEGLSHPIRSQVIESLYDVSVLLYSLKMFVIFWQDGFYTDKFFSSCLSQK